MKKIAVNKTKLELCKVSVFIILIAVEMGFAISTVFAWFSKNKKVTGSGMSVEVDAKINMKFDGEVIAVRHSLTGEVITNTYGVQEDKVLRLISSVSTNPEYEEPEVTNFLFDEMLPGEYVDITVSYISLDDFDSDYTVSFGAFDFTNGKYEINSVTYNVLGAFKTKLLSLTYYDEDDGIVSQTDYSSSEYEWLLNYTAGINSEEPEHIVICEDAWTSEYKKASLTFRVYEDFTQYYRLINAIGESIPNQLSEKVLRIGQIRISRKES